MSNPFLDHPILNSPYNCPQRHWELDTDGQPTQQILPTRRRAEFITPIPKPKKRKKAVVQDEMVFDEGKNLYGTRLGRKTRLPEPQRAVLWAIFEKVRGALASQKLIARASKRIVDWATMRSMWTAIARPEATRCRCSMAQHRWCWC